MKLSCQLLFAIILAIASGCSSSNGGSSRLAVQKSSSADLVPASATSTPSVTYTPSVRSASSSHAMTGALGNPLTDQQVQLCKLNDDFLNWEPPPQESNTIKMATAGPIREPDWNGRLQSILGDGTFTDWRVTVYSFLVNDHREISIGVSFACPAWPDGRRIQISLSTIPVDRIPWPHQRSAMPPSDPKIGSDISNFLSTVQQGDLVTASGKAFYERRYVGDLLFPTIYDLRIGRQNMGAGHLAVRFDKMSR